MLNITSESKFEGFIRNSPRKGIYYEKYVEETYKVIEGMLK